MHAVSAPVRNFRTKTGCLTCRARKVKCGEERPICSNCQRLRRECAYEALPYDHSLSSSARQKHTDFAASITSDTISTDIPADRELFSESRGIMSFTDFEDTNWLTDEWGDTTFEVTGHDIVSSDFTATATPLSYQQSGNYLTPGLTHVEMPFITPFDTSNWSTFGTFASGLAVSYPSVGLCLNVVVRMACVLNLGEDTADALPQYFAAKAAFAKLLKDSTIDLEWLWLRRFCCAAQNF